VEITFDNVHFFRDNPNVPSDLEQMPHLLSFLTSNGTVLSNMHTPLIAHTAEDSLAIYTGLYGDRHGMPLSNSYRTYNPIGTTDPATSFAYWTSPVVDTAATPTPGHDTAASMAYSPTVPAVQSANPAITPAPWVPFTRAGCTVGDFSTANMVLENSRVDVPTVFGAGSPEAAEPPAQQTLDFIGEAVHCAATDVTCAGSTGARPDLLPSEPGGYAGFSALFGHKYVAPRLGAGTPDLFHNGYRVTDANGNLVDLAGQPIADFRGNIGFPGFSPTASQSLAMLADMQEAGVPVTYGYIADIHERKDANSGCTTAAATTFGSALGPGDSCTAATARTYDQAFATFLDRLAADGITPANTEFVVGAEENDHFAGASVGRASVPAPVGCDGINTPCQYAADQVGELQANLPGLVATQRGNTTPFVVEPQGAAIYVTGSAAKPIPGADDPEVRQLERDTAAVVADNPFSGTSGETIANYQAGALEQRILHLGSADRLRTPTYTLFPKPDYFFSQGPPNCTAACVSLNTHFAWDHGYYSPDIDITWSGFVGPQVKRAGVDGPAADRSPAVLDPNALKTVPELSHRGTWADEVDVRPTLLHLVGLQDDYQSDGRVITQLLTREPSALRGTELLGACYKQLNASVGTFGTDTLIAETAALHSGSASDDSSYAATETRLGKLADARDELAQRMKESLSRAAAGHPVPAAVRVSELVSCAGLLLAAHHLAD